MKFSELLFEATPAAQISDAWHDGLIDARKTFLEKVRSNLSMITGIEDLKVVDSIRVEDQGLFAMTTFTNVEITAKYQGVNCSFRIVANGEKIAVAMAESASNFKFGPSSETYKDVEDDLKELLRRFTHED